MLNKDDLDNMAKPNGQIEFSSPCHRHAGVLVVYKNGVLTIECGECPDILAEIEIK